MKKKVLKSNNLFSKLTSSEAIFINDDCAQALKTLPDNSVDLVFTSPPYADQRNHTYGGISPDKYVEWFLPTSKELLRVIKPTGTFVLNIKEKIVSSERHTYVMELIFEMKKQGWLWTEEFIWHKKTAFRVSGPIVSVTHGSDFCNSIKTKNLTCTKMQSECLWAIGQKLD